MKLSPLIQDIADTYPNAVTERVKKTLWRYSIHIGCCEMIVDLLHRIKNMFLCLIGCSDWQRTMRAIKKENSAVVTAQFRAEVKQLHLSEQELNQMTKTLNRVLKILINQSNYINERKLIFVYKFQNVQFRSGWDVYINDTADRAALQAKSEIKKLKPVFEENNKLAIYNNYKQILREKTIIKDHDYIQFFTGKKTIPNLL